MMMFEKNDLKNFWAIFLGLNLVFLFYVISFFYGNHDVAYMRYYIPLNTGVWEGRPTQFILPHLLLGGKILPIFSVIIGFVFFSLAMVMLAKFWKVPHNYVVLFSFLILFNPYLLSQLYYVYLVLPFFAWHLFCILGVYVIYEKNKVSGAMLLFCALAGYAATLQLILVLVLGRFFIDICGDKQKISELFFHYLRCISIIAGAVFSYWLLIYYLKKYDFIYDGQYNVQTMPFMGVLQKLYVRREEPFYILGQNVPYLSSFASKIVYIMSLVSLVVCALRRRLIWGIMFSFMILYAMIAMEWLSPFDFWGVYRVNVYSVPYVIALSFAFIYRYGALGYKNIAFIFNLCLLFLFIKADFIGQKVWYLGNKQDELLVNRIHTDLATKIDYTKNYRLSLDGGLDGRKKFAHAGKLDRAQSERVAEYYGYRYFIWTNAGNLLFLFEERNPIYANFAEGVGFFIGNSDEFYEPRFASNELNPNNNQILNRLSVMKSYPSQSYLYADDMDIIMLLGHDVDMEQIRRNFEN